MLKVLLIDDHQIVREGLKKLIAQSFGAVTFGEAADGKAALTMFDKTRWDVVLLDLTLPNRDGLDLLQQMKSRTTGVPVLILSALAEKEVAHRVLKAGAAGFVPKETCSEDLVQAIRKVLAGGRYVSASLAEEIAFSFSKDKSEPHNTLSDREYLVLKMMASGNSVTDIARSLCLSPKTISTYRAHILRKLNVTTNAALIRYALKRGLVE